MNTVDWPRIAVMGAGAVGCYYAAMLARAGAKLTLIGRPEHVDAINRDGLTLETIDFTETIEAQASTEPAAVKDADLVLFCVKSTDTDEAARSIAPHLASRAVVLSLQNGVDNAERMQRHFRQPVISAVVYVAAAMAAPDHVRHSGRGDLVIGRSEPCTANSSDPLLETIAATFGRAGVEVRVSDNVTGELWIKLTTNCAYNAISALTQSRYGHLITQQPTQDIMRDVVEEIEALAAKKNIRLPVEDLLGLVFDLADAMPNATSSTAQDIARGRPTEIDHLNGYIAREGDNLGVPCPVNRTLHALIKLLENTER